MPAKSSTIIGAFVLGAFALGVVAILLFGGANLFAKKLRVVCYFQNSVAGLTVGAPVTLRGVQIGTVTSMKVYLKLPERVPVIPVYMDIEPTQVSWTKNPHPADADDIKKAIEAGLRAQLATQSLVTGQVSINLDFHPETPAVFNDPTGPQPEIPTIPSDIQRIRDEIVDLKLPELVDRARTTLVGVNEILGEMHGKVGPMLDSLRQTSAAAQVTLETATTAVQQLHADASHTLSSVDQLATTTQTQIATMGKNIGEVTTSADRTVTHADKVMENLNDLTARRSPLRDNLEATVRDLAASASSLRNFSREVERSPNAILFGKSSR